jgi:sugar-specific transcriptional regulator TrmB
LKIDELQEAKGMAEKANQDGKTFYFPVPAGTPYSIIAEAVNKFEVELADKEVNIPEMSDSPTMPKSWVIKGEKDQLIKAREHIIKKMEEMLEKFK